ncbi:hypothetical protein Tco_1485440 [Tanacetum coccineum]
MENNKSIDRSVQQKKLYKALVDAYECDKDILATYGDTVILKDVKMMRMKTKNPPLDQTEGPREEELEKNLSKIGHQRRSLPSQLASLKKGPNLIKSLPNEDPRESFNELMDTPLDFSTFVLNRLKVDTLTPELLADWNNPEGQQYPHDLRKPLALIPNSRRRRVILFDHLINNNLAYLSGDILSRTYATSVTKTKATDYGHIKWIEDLVPNTMWNQVPIDYAKHALWGISDWGKNVNNSMDLQNDDKLYTFKEGDYNKLRLQDIEDMLLLLVQGKLTNLNVEERLALGVSLRMFTRSIVLRRRVEDLQLGVESYQMKLNLTRPDTYRSDLKHKSAYRSYSNPRGFIYQNKDKKNRLMRIDKLYKFSDGTLNDCWE